MSPAPARPQLRKQPDSTRPDDGPPRPAGFKPITLATAQRETERLRGTIEKLEQRINAKDSAASAESQVQVAEPAADKEPRQGKSDAKAPEGKPTLASVERENRALRRLVDKLLLEVAKLDGTIPARREGLPPYDPHIIDSPTNAEFCPGKTMEQLEATMRFTGVPVGESEDQVAYEWTIYLTNAQRSRHVGHRVWALMKDGVSTNTMEAAPGIVREGPPPKSP